MHALTAELRQVLYEAALCTAFWVALWQLRGARAHGLRLVAGLALGALFGRVGGLLFVPAGLLLAAPVRSRAEFLDAALPALPFAFATAKLGCLAAGCCAAAGAEALGYAALGAGVHLTRVRGAALALGGVALVRLAVLPLRPEALPSLLPAVLWLALAALLCRLSRGGARCPSPGSAGANRADAGSMFSSGTGPERVAR
jgi:hypothetical protein